MPRTFQVELESTNRSSGPTARKFSKAIVSGTGIVILKPLTGEHFVIRIIKGESRFVAPARVTKVKDNRTTLAWINLLDSDREDLAEILGEAASKAA